MNKKGVSEVIGYVLLISITLIIAGMIFVWLRGTVVDTVVNEEVSCENDIALVLKDYSYDCDNRVLNLTIQNRGLFNVDGFTTKVSNVSGAKVGDYLLNKVGEKIAVTETASQNFNNLPEALTLVDIQAYKIQDGKTVYCKDAVVKQEVSCTNGQVCTDVFYLDEDKDFYGNFSENVTRCAVPVGYISIGADNKFDCNDSNININPGAVEVCDDGIDNDCVGGDADCGCVVSSYTPALSTFCGSKSVVTNCGTTETKTGTLTCTSEQFCSNNACLPKWVYDENADSYYESADGFLYMNYTIPSGALSSSKWLYKYGNAMANVTLNQYPSTWFQPCWNVVPGKLLFRIFTNATLTAAATSRVSSDAECYVGGAWMVIGTLYSEQEWGVVTSYNMGISDSTGYKDGNWNTYTVRFHQRKDGNYNDWRNLYETNLDDLKDSRPRVYEEAMWWNYA